LLKFNKDFRIVLASVRAIGNFLLDVHICVSPQLGKVLNGLETEENTDPQFSETQTASQCKIQMQDKQDI